MNLIHSANILVIQSYGYYSHIKVQYALFQELLQNGHNLIIFTPRLMDYGGLENVTQHHFYENFWESNNSTFDEILNILMTYGGGHMSHLAYTAKVIEAHLNNPEFKKLFFERENFKFDLIMLETDLYICEILAEIYDCPIIKLAACEMEIFHHEMIGNLAHPSIHSSVFLLPKVHGELDFFDRVLSFFVYTFEYIFNCVFEHLMNDILQDDFLPELKYPRGYEISNRRLFMKFNFLNLMTTSIRPTVLNFNLIGFNHIQPPKSLGNDLQNFINNSKNGVILLSIGSELTFTEHHQKIFINAFKTLPFDLTWKVEPESIQKFVIPENVFASNWLPISDILAHPNVKALITHGGARTIEEAIDREIPTIFIPMVCDQHFNVKLLNRRNVGLNLDINELSEKSVMDAIYEITKMEYKENMQKYKKFVYDQIMSSREIAVENVEYLLKHRDVYHYQQYEGRNIGFITRYFIDIYIIIASLIFIIYLIRNFFTQF